MHARALAIGSLLNATSFPMVAAPAPEPRDLIWNNVTARPGAASAWCVRAFILGLLVAWVVFSIAVASVPDLFDDIDGDRDQAIDGDSLAYRVVLLPESEGAARAAARRAPDPDAPRSLARGTRRRGIRRHASAAARTTATDPCAQTLALRPRLGLVLWGLAGLEERPERNVVLPEELAALLAPGPRGLARVDDGRAGLHLLVLPVGED